MIKKYTQPTSAIHLSIIIILALIMTGCTQKENPPAPSPASTEEVIESVSPISPVSVVPTPQPTLEAELFSTPPAQLTEPLEGQINQNGLEADFVKLPLYELFFWTGMTWNNSDQIWIINNQIKLIAGLNTETLVGDRNLEFPTSDNLTKEPYFTGIAWDGSNLWISDVENRIIYQIDPNSGEKITDFTYDGIPAGMVWLDDNLWLISMEKRVIEKLSATGESQDSIELQGVWPTGLAWDGTYFWYSDGKDGSIYILNPTNGKIKPMSEIQFLTTPETFNGLEWIDNYLWVVTEYKDQIYRFDLSQLDWEEIEADLE